MSGEQVRLGPFTGGLNTISDPTTIADVELAECINFEQDLDGSLKSRPPFKEIAGHASFTERILFLCEAVFGSDHYLIGSNVNGVYFFLNGSFTLITSTFQAGAAVQYADKVYLIPKPGSGNGGRWDPSGGFVAVAAIPKGRAVVVHKERLYVCPGISATADTSRLKFSDPGTPETWPGSNFIDVQQGDGTKLVDLVVYQDNLLLFKETSAHILSYDTLPEDSSLKPISQTIGVTRQNCVINYENQVYVLSNGWVYEITNLDFLRLNVKVKFIRDEGSPSAFSDESLFISLLEDRIICRFYKKIYVYGIRTRSWSEWSSKETNLHYFGPIFTVRPSTGNRYFSGNNLQALESVVEFLDFSTATSVESVLSANVRQAISAGTASTTDYLVTADADATDINVGDYIQLYTSGDVLKEGTTFRVTSKASAFGFTNIIYTPNSAVVTTTGDKLKIVSRIFCTAKTKNFDMAISHQYKRLWWWGASVSTNNEIFGTLTPITTNFVVTWDDLMNYTWDDFFTWDQLLQQPSFVQTIVSTGRGVVRQAIKFKKAVRYIQISFQVMLTTVGSAVDGPAKLFTMVAFTNVKQIVSKEVS